MRGTRHKTAYSYNGFEGFLCSTPHVKVVRSLSNSQFEKIMVRRHLHGKMGVDNDREANRADKKWT